MESDRGNRGEGSETGANSPANTTPWKQATTLAAARPKVAELESHLSRSLSDLG